MRPTTGDPTHRILFVNGILNTPDDHHESLQAIADRAQAEVLGIYNATEGLGRDLAQCLGDKLDLGRNPAVDTLSSTLYAELTSSSSPVNLMAHSQGALITSRALEDVKLMLMQDGLSRAEAEARLSRVNIETFGGAAWTYPDGPNYRHSINALDPVSTLFGQGSSLLGPVGLLMVDGGAGAQTSTFLSTQGNLHGFNEVYLPQFESSFPREGPK